MEWVMRMTETWLFAWAAWRTGKEIYIWAAQLWARLRERWVRDERC